VFDEDIKSACGRVLPLAKRAPRFAVGRPYELLEILLFNA
jgi:hypothetical protein